MDKEKEYDQFDWKKYIRKTPSERKRELKWGDGKALEFLAKFAGESNNVEKNEDRQPHSKA